MIDYFNSIIDNSNIPLLSALLLGIMTSISPCPLATNITAIAYISREIKDNKKVLINGLMYTLGRGITYTILAIILYSGFSAFNVQAFFQQWGDKLLGPLLIVIGLFMLDVIKINLKGGNKFTEKFQNWTKEKGYLGSLLLGILFSLAFCPTSAVFFFGMLIPLIVIPTNNPIFAPLFFSIGTGLPVMFFALILAFGAKKLGNVFNSVKKIELWIRKITGIIFIAVGIYYLKYLILYIFR